MSPDVFCYLCPRPLSQAYGQLGVYSFSIRVHIGQTPNWGLPLISSKFSIGQYLHLVEECQTDVPFVLRVFFGGSRERPGEELEKGRCLAHGCSFRVAALSLLSSRARSIMPRVPKLRVSNKNAAKRQVDTRAAWKGFFVDPVFPMALR